MPSIWRSATARRKTSAPIPMSICTMGRARGTASSASRARTASPIDGALARMCDGVPARDHHMSQRHRMVSEMDAKTKDKVEKSDAEWRQQLTPEQYKVARQHGTERAFTGEFWDHHEAGEYRCVCCGELLFESNDKFDSGCGWPSFTQPKAKDAVETQTDRSHMMVRT